LKTAFPRNDYSSDGSHQSCLALLILKIKKAKLLTRFKWLTSAYPRNDDSGDWNLDAGVFEQFVPQVDAVPKADDVTLDCNVVLTVKSIKNQKSTFT